MTGGAWWWLGEFLEGDPEGREGREGECGGAEPREGVEGSQA